MRDRAPPWRALAAALVLAAVSPPALAGESAAACLPGRYDGGQMEMAAGLELGADGRFRYGLSYGALDEAAEGHWEQSADGAVLTSDPVTPPRFVFAGEQPGPGDALHIALDLPRGISRQYFDVRLDLADGRRIERQFAEDGLGLVLGKHDRPVAVTVVLDMFALQSERFSLSGRRSGRVALRFEPNDLGKVAFAGTTLVRENGDLLLDRHGRRLRFRRVGEACPAH